MRTGLYTIHERADGRPVRIVGDPGLIALIPPLWAALEGLWITLGAMALAFAGLALWHPLGILPAFVALALICWLDGASLIRLELRLTGWREAACVEARSRAGAEELYLTGAHR